MPPSDRSAMNAGLAEVQSLLMAGRLEEGIAAADRLLAADPQCHPAEFLKGVALFHLGEPAKALEGFRRVLGVQPENPDVLAWASMASSRAGQGEEAERSARSLLRMQPGNPRAYQLLSEALFTQERFLEAMKAIDQALLASPGEADLVIAKARILNKLGWASQAIEWYAKALKSRPVPDLGFEMALLLLEEGRPGEAVTVLENFAAKGAVPDELLAAAYTEAQRFEAAEPVWKRADDSAGIVARRAMSEIYAGRLDVAEALLWKGIDEYPTAAELYLTLARITRFDEAHRSTVQRMEDLLSEFPPESSAAQELHYALGKAYEDLQTFEQAMDQFDRANAIAYRRSPSAQSFDRESWRAYTDFQIEFFSAERMATLAKSGQDSDVPLFVVGMIRSGTTLTEQILSAHSLVAAGGEKTFWPDHREEVLDSASGRYNTEAAGRLGTEYLNLLRARAPEALHVTEKNPSNVTLAAMLHCIYPAARFVHIRRHPVDNLVSIWTTPMRTGLPFVHDKENLVFAYQEYRRLAEHLDAVMPPDRFRTFSYEDLTASPDFTIREMLEYLRLPVEEACFRPEANRRTVRTPSYHQVRQSIHTTSQERWRRYEPWLGSFLTLILAEK